MEEAKRVPLDEKGRPVATNRVASDDVETQGPGTWVEFRASLRLKHLRAVAEMATFASVDFGTNQQEALDAFGRIGAVMSSLVLAWNWTDEEGEPLAQPRDNAEVFEELTFPELNWLISQLGADVGPKAVPAS